MTLPIGNNRQKGFTILEIVVALLIMMLVLGLGVYFYEGVEKERQLTDPVTELRSMAKSTMRAASIQHRRYVMVLNTTSAETFSVAALAQRNVDNRFITDEADFGLKDEPERFGFDLENTELPPEQRRPEILSDRLDLHQSVTLKIRPWGMKKWIAPENYEWVFDASGLCEPLSVRFEQGNSFYEIEFNPLTAGVEDSNAVIQ